MQTDLLRKHRTYKRNKIQKCLWDVAGKYSTCLLPEKKIKQKTYLKARACSAPAVLKRSSGARQKACVKNMVGEKVPAELRSFLLRILCDVGFCASHAPVQVSKNLHQSSFTPPATLLLHFPCGAWWKRKYLTFKYFHICVSRISYIRTQERSGSLYVLRSKHLVLSCRPCHFASGFVCRDRCRGPRESE